MKSISTAQYAVHFNDNAYVALNSHLEKCNYSKVFILVDENTHELCLPPFMAAIHGDFDFEIIEIESGEVNKTIETCTQLWHVLSELDGDRKSLMINLGGGVITDMGGFIASTFKRGIDFINVPTTLLSMVDASVGGKTGIDLGSLKNQIGVINQPEMVLIITSFLKTLEKQQLYSGYAEMLKHGLIKSRSYWQTLQQIDNFNNLDSVIYESVLIKNDVVTQDPTEQGLRKILNYGHTLGHAIESYFLESKTHETLLHGEAIAIGMVMEAYISSELTGLSKTDLLNIKEIFSKRYKKVNIIDEDISKILRFLKFDKKNSHGNINFVLLKSIGECKIDVIVTEKLMLEAFAYYKV